METRDTIRGILEKTRTIAVYGMSKHAGKASYWVPEYLAGKGFDIIPVNPSAGVILNRKCYPDLRSVPDRIDVVQVFRRSEEALEPVREAVARRKDRGDVDVVWLQQGIRNEEARRLAEENGILFVQDRCMYREWKMIHLVDG
ncbi:MAG: hypothetical protein A4E67_00894 [Syntrophaceae bacterium PtaB.Bin038]|nr:MAG: hypothetical protein A4E67_00894 [Syntrophaceae bacterium PtaB.Bin038]